MSIDTAAAAMVQTSMNADLATSTTYTGKGRDEKAAEKRAKQAEAAFRASKGYTPDNFWYRLRQHLRSHSHHE